MSFWARISGVKIEDLECFRNACGANEVDYQVNEDPEFYFQGNKVVATLTDKSGQGHQAYLVEHGGASTLMMDNDRNYSSFSRRLGRDAAKLVRDYAYNVVEQNVMNEGGMINSVEETQDGGLLLHVASM